MNITRNRIKELVRETLTEENEYQAFFKKALEKAGKSIPNMSDEEKKTFFNKIDATWKGKGEKREPTEEVCMAKASKPTTTEASQTMTSMDDMVSSIKYSKDGYVKRMTNNKGKLVKDITLNGVQYRYNTVYKTYNSVKGNEILHKSMTESVNEASYTNQTGIKSSLMGEPEFNRIVDEKTKQWIRFGKDVIIMKTGRFLVITDGKRELVITGSSPFKVLKKLGKITGETKKQYQSMNEATVKGRNNKTGESFGIALGADKQDKDTFRVLIRKSYSERISEIEWTFDKDINLISSLDYGYSLSGYPSHGGGSGKSYGGNKRETITVLAKEYSPAFAKKVFQYVQSQNKAQNEMLNNSMNESKPVKGRKSHYNVEYHGVKYGHDDVANYPSFKQAVQKATQLKNDELFGYTLEDETDYIGVDGNGGNGEEFAIIYIDTRFFKSVNADDFGSKEDYTTWMKFAKKSLNSKKPVIGKYPNIGESQNKAQNEMLNNSMNESKPVKGKKSFYQQDNIGKTKYTLNTYDGKGTHKDGSPFYGIKIFKNKKDLAAAKAKLFKQGYIEESVTKGKLKKGDRVKVIGTQYNGKEGLIISNDMHRGSYQVQVDGKVKGFKPNEIKKLTEGINESSGFPNMKKWWNEKPEDILTFVYWMKKQTPPKDRDKAYKDIATQLNKQFKAPSAIYKGIVGESVNEGGETEYEVFYNKKKIIVKSSDGIWDAKQQAFKLLKVPKSKQGLVAIQSMTSKKNQDFRFN